VRRADRTRPSGEATQGWSGLRARAFSQTSSIVGARLSSRSLERCRASHLSGATEGRAVGESVIKFPISTEDTYDHSCY
jgi:hypothetical protein